MTNELYTITVADVESALRRPLADGEASSIRKTLDGIEWADLLDGHNAESTDFRAAGLTAGHWYREYGMDDWLKVTKADWHGDTVLLWTEDIDGAAGETAIDGDTVVALLVTNKSLRA